MMFKKIEIWLWKFIKVSYIYIFTMAILMHFDGHNKITPNHPDKNYPMIYGVPQVSQESIDIAMENFEIQVPMLTLYPKLDTDMDEEALGLAHVFPLIHTCIPTIGPGAFTSWGKLGAILAHEIEVHCNQNWWKAITDKIFNEDPKAMLEREAYTYMILDSKRFHLTTYEQASILYTMLSLYPVGDKNEQRQSTPEIKERTHGSTEGI